MRVHTLVILVSTRWFPRVPVTKGLSLALDECELVDSWDITLQPSEPPIGGPWHAGGMDMAPCWKIDITTYQKHGQQF